MAGHARLCFPPPRLDIAAAGDGDDREDYNDDGNAGTGGEACGVDDGRATSHTIPKTDREGAVKAPSRERYFL